MKESYVSYECAVKLKECGFDWECDDCYVINKAFNTPHLQNYASGQDWNTSQIGGVKYEYIHISAPRLDQAQKWLREVKGIDVLVFNCACGYGWEISKSDPQSRGTTIALFDDNGEDESSGMWLSYESALSAGIDAALKILEESYDRPQRLPTLS